MDTPKPVIDGIKWVTTFFSEISRSLFSKGALGFDCNKNMKRQIWIGPYS
jgi:hypothetical protein